MDPSVRFTFRGKTSKRWDANDGNLITCKCDYMNGVLRFGCLTFDELRVCSKQSLFFRHFPVVRVAYELWQGTVPKRQRYELQLTPCIVTNIDIDAIRMDLWTLTSLGNDLKSNPSLDVCRALICIQMFDMLTRHFNFFKLDKLGGEFYRMMSNYLLPQLKALDEQTTESLRYIFTSAMEQQFDTVVRGWKKTFVI